MSEPNESQTAILEQMRQGISLARTGDKAGAEALFDGVLARRPNHEEALIWKAAVVNDPAETIRCLEQVLRLNPDNKRAQVGLEWAYRRQKSGEGEPALKTQTPPAPQSVSTWPAPPPASARTTQTFQPGVEKAAHRVEPETKATRPPYKKRRLTEAQSEGIPSMDLPPEALRSSPADKPKKSKTRPRVEDSSVFRAATETPVAFSVTPKVARAQARPGLAQRTRQPVPLRWSLGAFGLALLLALLTFPFSGLASSLGALALIAALMGVVLFNRTQL